MDTYQNVGLAWIVNALIALAAARLLVANVDVARKALRYGSARKDVGHIAMLVGVDLIFAAVAAIPLRANQTQLSLMPPGNSSFAISQFVAIISLFLVVAAVPIVSFIAMLAGGPRDHDNMRVE